MAAKKHALGSDLAKVDAHVISPEEYEEIPKLTDEWFEQVDLRQNGKLIRRGHPPKDSPKVPVTLRLDADLVAQLRASGQGWQPRVNDILRQAEGLPKLGGRRKRRHAALLFTTSPVLVAPEMIMFACPSMATFRYSTISGSVPT